MISENGTLSLNGKKIQTPVHHSAIEAILGSPSKIINRQPYRDYIWDQLGVVTLNDQKGKLIKLNLKLRGHMKEKVRDPKFRFNGSLTIPTGTIQFHPENVKTDKLGFQPFMGSNDVIIQNVGGVEIIIIGSKLKLGKPDFVSISFKN